MDNLAGTRFGRLLVKRRNGKTKHGSALWLCLCDCGNEKTIRAPELKKGKTKSCGCLSRELAAERGKTLLKKHGGCGTRIYRIWCGMRQRCREAGNPRYASYGGRGIVVCEEWESFERFKEWAMQNGYADNLSIDRIDVNGNYEPSNCRWADAGEQADNKRNTVYIPIGDDFLTLKEYVKMTGANENTVRTRIRKQRLRTTKNSIILGG